MSTFRCEVEVGAAKARQVLELLRSEGAGAHLSTLTASNAFRVIVVPINASGNAMRRKAE